MLINPYIIPGLEVHKPIEAVNVEFMVCQVLELEPILMQQVKKNRKREYVEARYIVFYILVKHFKWKLERTGKFYDKDHATVLYGIKTVNNLMQTNKEFRSKVSSLIDI